MASLDKEQALKQLQAQELELLKIFSNYCNKHNLVWWLDSGTALGSRRHRGFIPWDDDVDVGMPRSEYGRLINLWTKKGETIDGVELAIPRKTQGYAPTFAKLMASDTVFETQETLNAGFNQGIFIDIFPYDAVATDKNDRKKQIANAKKWQALSYMFHSKNVNVPHKGIVGLAEKGGCFLVHHLVNAFSSDEKIHANFDKSVLDDSLTCDKVITLAWPYFEPLHESVFMPCQTGPFEGEEFPVPRDIDAYLVAVYGDWKQIPSPENQKTHLPLKLVFANGDVYYE